MITLSIFTSYLKEVYTKWLKLQENIACNALYRDIPLLRGRKRSGHCSLLIKQQTAVAFFY